MAEGTMPYIYGALYVASLTYAHLLIAFVSVFHLFPCFAYYRVSFVSVFHLLSCFIYYRVSLWFFSSASRCLHCLISYFLCFLWINFKFISTSFRANNFLFLLLLCTLNAFKCAIIGIRFLDTFKVNWFIGQWRFHSYLHTHS